MGAWRERLRTFVAMLVLPLLLAATSSAAAPPACNGGMCSSLAHYSVRNTTSYAEFDVPKLLVKVGPTFFIYYNIDWQAAGPKGSDARMNQFVPQLMLGNPLCDSTGPPDYKPIWHEQKTWVFGAQYFFEIFDQAANKTQGHAATGKTYPTKEGETIYTKYTLSDDWVWTLEMGVKGDATRVSTVVVPKPFMGLLPESQTSSWSEPVYASAWGNACWELYGVEGGPTYPGGMTFTWTVSHVEGTEPTWAKWSAQTPTCPGHPEQTISQVDSPDKQEVTWKISFDVDPDLPIMAANRSSHSNPAH